MWSSLRVLALFTLAVVHDASAYLSPPAGAITIGGSKGQYSTIGAALNDTSSDVYFVYAGNYTEGVLISRPNVRIYGQTAVPLSYLGNSEAFLLLSFHFS
jgi:pectinesterase